ncbi:MAG: DUF6636 domain-containing protein [Cyanobacteria bacterium P01_C01_bin.89]
MSKLWNKAVKGLGAGAIATGLVLSATASHAVPKQSYPNHFTTPSGKIQCEYFNDSGLRCELTTGQNLRPLGRRPSDCNLDWGGGLTLSNSGTVEVLCAGDTIKLPRSASNTLAYGRSWSRGGIRCVVQRTGLTCKNRRDQGFFLSTQRWYRIN